LPRVKRPAVCKVIFAAPEPVVVIAPLVDNVPVLLITDNVPPATELLATNVILRLLLKLILPEVLFVKLPAFAKLLALLKLIPSTPLNVKQFCPLLTMYR